MRRNYGTNEWLREWVALILKQVHLCEAEGMQDFLDEDASVERIHGGSPLLVAVKTLREDANKNARCRQSFSSSARHSPLVPPPPRVRRALVSDVQSNMVTLHISLLMTREGPFRAPRWFTG